MRRNCGSSSRNMVFWIPQTLKNGFPTLKIGGGVPYTPTRPLLLSYTLVGTLPRICHIYIYVYIYRYRYIYISIYIYIYI